MKSVEVDTLCRYAFHSKIFPTILLIFIMFSHVTYHNVLIHTSQTRRRPSKKNDFLELRGIEPRAYRMQS